MASEAEVAYWRERALFYERRLVALGASVEYAAPPSTRPRWWRGGQMTVDDCIAEVERG